MLEFNVPKRKMRRQRKTEELGGPRPATGPGARLVSNRTMGINLRPYRTGSDEPRDGSAGMLPIRRATPFRALRLLTLRSMVVLAFGCAPTSTRQVQDVDDVRSSGAAAKPQAVPGAAADATALRREALWRFAEWGLRESHWQQLPGGPIVINCDYLDSDHATDCPPRSQGGLETLPELAAAVDVYATNYWKNSKNGDDANAIRIGFPYRVATPAENLAGLRDIDKLRWALMKMENLPGGLRKKDLPGELAWLAERYGLRPISDGTRWGRVARKDGGIYACENATEGAEHRPPLIRCFEVHADVTPAVSAADALELRREAMWRCEEWGVSESRWHQLPDGAIALCEDMDIGRASECPLHSQRRYETVPELAAAVDAYAAKYWATDSDPSPDAIRIGDPVQLRVPPEGLAGLRDIDRLFWSLTKLKHLPGRLRTKDVPAELSWLADRYGLTHVPDGTDWGSFVRKAGGIYECSSRSTSAKYDPGLVVCSEVDGEDVVSEGE